MLSVTIHLNILAGMTSNVLFKNTCALLISITIIFKTTKTIINKGPAAAQWANLLIIIVKQQGIFNIHYLLSFTYFFMMYSKHFCETLY